MSKTIQRQSIFSTLIIFVGFGFGALNLMVLQKTFLTLEQWGLTRVITEAAVLMASFATLGTPAVIAKFHPFYQRYLPSQKNDQPAITLAIFAIGLTTTLLLLQWLKTQIVTVFGRNNSLFEPYYFVLLFFVLFQAVFMYMEMHAWFSGKTVLANFLKELLFRALTTVCLLAIGFNWVAFDGFMTLFSLVYLPAAIVLVITVRRSGGLPLVFKISALTRRLWKKMLSLGSFVFFTMLSNIAFVVCDTLFLASMYNFGQAGIYAVAQYFSQILEVPMRSIQAASVPLVSEYWRAKNMVGLASVYRKSCINLLITAMGLGGLIIVNLANLEAYFGKTYAVMIAPLAILVVARWVNLGTGLNQIIIQLSTFWRFDFASTLIYSVIGIPLNFILIRDFGMMGAAIANFTAMVIYNGIRFLFIFKKFGLQPFSIKNLQILLLGIALIAVVYFIPNYTNFYVDGILRSLLFAGLYAFSIIKAGFSEEINFLWAKWGGKLGLRR